MKKKYIKYCICLMILLLGVIFKFSEIREHKLHNVEKSFSVITRYDKKEVDEAMDVVIEYIQEQEFEGFYMKEIWYDEEYNDWFNEGQEEEVLVLQSTLIEGIIWERQTYDRWCWLLKFNTNNEQWEIIECGY